MNEFFRRAAQLMALLVALSVSAHATPAGQRYMPLAEISAGQVGQARTVLQGRDPQLVPLEILGVAPGYAGPGRDMILARLKGEAVRRTGVVAGMSGSPVTIGDRLVGALSFRIGSFTSEAIAGITPIEQMLSIPDSGPQNPVVGSEIAGRYALKNALDPNFIPQPGTARTPMGLTPIAVSGLTPGPNRSTRSVLEQAGLGPMVAAVATARAPRAPRILSGGDSVAAVLVKGDMIIAATGTATLVEGRRVLAFGHPLTGAGPADYPMALAEVLVTVPSLAGSFKMVRIGEVVGAFHQDRTAGLAGRLGDQSRLIHLDLGISGRTPGPSQHLSFDLIRSPALAPALLEAILGNALSSSDRGSSRGTLMLKGCILLNGHRSLDLDYVFAADAGSAPVAFQAARLVAALVRVIMVSPGGLNPELALDLTAELLPASHILKLEEVHLLTSQARAGDVLQLRARLRDLSTGETRIESFSLPLPDMAHGARLQLLVGDAAAFSQADSFGQLARLDRAANLPAVLNVLGSLRSAGGLYCRLTRPSPGLVLGTQPLPDLPPSVAMVMNRDRSISDRSPLQKALIIEQSQIQPGVVRGARRLNIEIE